MPDLARVQLVLNRSTGLPEDRVVNTFWFMLPDDHTTTDYEYLTAQVESWLTSAVPATTTKLVSYLSSQVAATGMTVNLYTYDMATGDRLAYDGAPAESSRTLGTQVVGTTAEPAEVALCVSFRNNSGAVPGVGVVEAPAQRRRGRVYFGPLSKEAVSIAGAGDARPLSTFVTCLVESTERMREAAAATSRHLVIYSRPYAGRGEIERPGRPTLPAIPARGGTAFQAEQVWADDAFDTQRRRGAVRSFRYTPA